MAEERISDVQLDGDGAAQIAGQQNGTRVTPIATIRFSERPSRAHAASTLETFISLAMLSKTRNNTTSAL